MVGLSGISGVTETRNMMKSKIKGTEEEFKSSWFSVF